MRRNILWGFEFYRRFLPGAEPLSRSEARETLLFGGGFLPILVVYYAVFLGLDELPTSPGLYAGLACVAVATADLMPTRRQGLAAPLSLLGTVLFATALAMVAFQLLRSF